MKTNEDSIPWDPNEQDQKVDSNLLKAGLDQLERDVLRFFEMLPDLEMAPVKIVTNVAFPLAIQSSEKALAKDDFESVNSVHLLQKLGIPTEARMHKPTAEMEAAYKRTVCRYLGVHAQIPAKVPLGQGFEALELAVKGTDSVFKAQASNMNVCDELETETAKMAVARDAWMKEIRRAVLVPKFGKTFQVQNPNIQLKDLKQDKDRFLKQTSTKQYPLFGKSVVEAVLRAVDDQAAHQGAEAILTMLKKEKYLFFNKDGSELDLKSTVEDHVRRCIDCSEVGAIKEKIPQGSGFLLQIPETMEADVLVYADRRHQGFAEAHRRVKTWADFPDFKRKVVLQKSIFLNF